MGSVPTPTKRERHRGGIKIRGSRGNNNPRQPDDSAEKTVENSIKNTETHGKRRTGEESRIDRTTRESTQGERNPPSNEREKQSNKNSTGECNSQRGRIKAPRENNGPTVEIRREGAREPDAEKIRTSRYGLAKKHGQENAMACPEEKNEECQAKPGERIIAKVGISKRKPVATHKWHVKQQYEGQQDDKVLMSCTAVVTIDDAEHQVSCYKKSGIDGAHVFRCPTPWVIRAPNNEENEINHPRGEEEYEVDATLWLMPAPRNDIVVAWKRVCQDPYARIRKGIGVCYHCGKACGKPSTCRSRKKTCYTYNRTGHTLGAC